MEHLPPLPAAAPLALPNLSPHRPRKRPRPGPGDRKVAFREQLKARRQSLHFIETARTEFAPGAPDDPVAAADAALDALAASIARQAAAVEAGGSPLKQEFEARVLRALKDKLRILTEARRSLGAQVGAASFPAAASAAGAVAAALAPRLVHEHDDGDGAKDDDERPGHDDDKLGGELHGGEPPAVAR